MSEAKEVNENTYSFKNEPCSTGTETCPCCGREHKDPESDPDRMKTELSEEEIKELVSEIKNLTPARDVDHPHQWHPTEMILNMEHSAGLRFIGAAEQSIAAIKADRSCQILSNFSMQVSMMFSVIPEWERSDQLKELKEKLDKLAIKTQQDLDAIHQGALQANSDLDEHRSKVKKLWDVIKKRFPFPEAKES